MTELMEKESLQITMVLNILENGQMTFNMVKDKSPGIMEKLNIKDNFLKVKRMVKASLNGMMVVFMKETLQMEYFRDMENISLLIQINGMKENLE